MSFVQFYNLIKDLSSLTFFRFVQFSLITLQTRDEVCGESGALPSHHAHHWQPFSLWLSNLLMAYAGEILENVLLCITPLEIFRNWHDLLLYTVAWYCMYYSPLDTFHAIARTTSYRVLAVFVSTVSMVLHVDKTMQNVAKYFNRDWLPIIIVGATVGSSGELLKPIVCFVINRCQHNQLLQLKLSISSKIALIVAFVYALELMHREVFAMCHEQVQLCLLAFLLLYRYTNMICPMDEYIWLVEAKLCYTLLGGWFSDIVKLCKSEHSCCGSDFGKFH